MEPLRINWKSSLDSHSQYGSASHRSGGDCCVSAFLKHVQHETYVLFECSVAKVEREEGEVSLVVSHARLAQRNNENMHLDVNTHTLFLRNSDLSVSLQFPHTFFP